MLILCFIVIVLVRWGLILVMMLICLVVCGWNGVWFVCGCRWLCMMVMLLCWWWRLMWCDCWCNG